MCILFALIFMLIFGIAFGRPLAAFWRIVGSTQGPFWSPLAHFFADAAKLKNATFLSEMLGLGGAGPPVLHDFFLTFSSLFSMLLRLHFRSISEDLGLQRGALLESIFAEFAKFA